MSTSAAPGPISVGTLTAAEAWALVPALGAVLADCVDGGASVSYMPPFGQADAEAAFRDVAADVEAGRTILLAAFGGDELIGTVQVELAWRPNQPHRAGVAKMLVHRRARRQGVGTLLLREAEAAALRAGRWLLCLDTETGGAAERLYRAEGWVECGLIPDYALRTDGQLSPTTLFYKRLR
jgi:GNAT superfamily N-acetyltransferase